MRSLFSRTGAAAVAGIVLVALAAPAFAAETSSSRFVIIREETVFPDDLYATAVQVIVDGTLDGDLVAFAAEEIVINGTVTGSVFGISPRVIVNGEVGGSLRVTASLLTVTGDVGGDVVAPIVNADFSSTSSVEGDLLVWAWNLRSVGAVGEDLAGTQRSVELAGFVGGDVDVTVTELNVVDSLTVGGDFAYRSEAEAGGVELVSAGGAVVHRTPLPPNLRVRGLAMLGRLLVVLMLSVAALTVAYGWPQRTLEATKEAAKGPVRRWLLGAPIVFSPVVLAAMTLFLLGMAPATAAFPLLVILIPVILAVTGVVVALCLVAGAPFVAWLGGVLFRRLELYGSILAGSLLVGVVWYLPLVGWLVPLVVLPLGLGSWLATWRRQRVVTAEPVS